jgi:hypothetical protein
MADSTSPPGRRRRRAKTWSELGDLGRRPTEYEIVTHGMNHTMGGDLPLELGPDVKGNRWLREHRDAMRFANVDWEAFRDPDALTYESYCAMQDDAETYVDAVLRRFDADTDSDASASDPLMALQLRALTPTRYPTHALQLLSAYVQQLAPSAYVANCASFQTADLLRRIQRTAERTKMMQLAHPDAGFGTSERQQWETAADWQPIREALERALVEFEWDRAFCVTQLVLKPVIDSLFLDRLAGQLDAAGGELDARIVENLSIDAHRSRRWTAALARHIASSDPANAAVMAEVIDEWRPAALELIEAGARLVTTEQGPTATEIAASTTRDWEDFLASTGLTPVAP